MSKHIIDKQFDLAILVAMEEVGAPVDAEKLHVKLKSFIERWKKTNPEKQGNTRIRGRLSSLTQNNIVKVTKKGGQASYYLPHDERPEDIIANCLSELFEYVPISIIGDDIIFDYAEANENTLIFELEEIAAIIKSYRLMEKV